MPDHKSRPLTDDEMEERAQRNLDRMDDVRSSDMTPCRVADNLNQSKHHTADMQCAIQDLDSVEFDGQLNDAELAAMEQLDQEDQNDARAARRDLIREGVTRYSQHDRNYYEKKRKFDRDEYAAKVGRPVRPYNWLKSMTAEEKKAYKNEQARKRMQRMRQARKPDSSS